MASPEPWAPTMATTLLLIKLNPRPGLERRSSSMELKIAGAFATDRAAVRLYLLQRWG
jgi:hypothetical protein